MQTSDSEEALQLMRKHTREELCKVLEYAETNFELTVTSFIHENLRGLRRAMGSTKFEKQLVVKAAPAVINQPPMTLSTPVIR